MTSSVAEHVNCLFASSFKMFETISLSFLGVKEYFVPVKFSVLLTLHEYFKLRLWLLGVVVDVLLHVNIALSPTDGVLFTVTVGILGIPESHIVLIKQFSKTIITTSKNCVRESILWLSGPELYYLPL
jgi:hypothetical protein